MADRLLNSLVSLLLRPDASMADNTPGQPPGAGGERLEGKLSLTRALVQVRFVCTLSCTPSAAEGEASVHKTTVHDAGPPC